MCELYLLFLLEVVTYGDVILCLFVIAVYSSREVGKLQCFHWIRERVQGLPLRFCVIGDGVDECEAANGLSWPFLKIHIGPNAVYQLPTVSMEIIDHHMKIVYEPSDMP